MEHLERAAPARERREGRTRLTVSDPLVKSAVLAINFSGFNVAETERFGNIMVAAARRHMIGKEVRSQRRLTQREAAFALGRALAELAAGRRGNG